MRARDWRLVDGRWQAPIPGAPGAFYIITRTWDDRWDVGASARLPGPFEPGVGTYGADRLFGGQPTHATPGAAMAWTNERSHARFASLMRKRKARCQESISRGYLG